MPKPIRNTPAVPGSMSLRNREVATSVFWGARPRENRHDRLARLQSSQEAMSVAMPSAMDNETAIIPFITLDSDDDVGEPSEALINEIKDEPTEQIGSSSTAATEQGSQPHASSQDRLARAQPTAATEQGSQAHENNQDRQASPESLTGALPECITLDSDDDNDAAPGPSAAPGLNSEVKNEQEEMSGTEPRQEGSSSAGTNAQPRENSKDRVANDNPDCITLDSDEEPEQTRSGEPSLLEARMKEEQTVYISSFRTAALEEVNAEFAANPPSTSTSRARVPEEPQAVAAAQTPSDASSRVTTPEVPSVTAQRDPSEKKIHGFTRSLAEILERNQVELSNDSQSEGSPINVSSKESTPEVDAVGRFEEFVAESSPAPIEENQAEQESQVEGSPTPAPIEEQQDMIEAPVNAASPESTSEVENPEEGIVAEIPAEEDQDVTDEIPAQEPIVDLEPGVPEDAEPTDNVSAENQLAPVEEDQVSNAADEILKEMEPEESQNAVATASEPTDNVSVETQPVPAPVEGHQVALASQASRADPVEEDHDVTDAEEVVMDTESDEIPGQEPIENVEPEEPQEAAENQPVPVEEDQSAPASQTSTRTPTPVHVEEDQVVTDADEIVMEEEPKESQDAVATASSPEPAENVPVDNQPVLVEEDQAAPASQASTRTPTPTPTPHPSNVSETSPTSTEVPALDPALLVDAGDSNDSNEPPAHSPAEIPPTTPPAPPPVANGGNGRRKKKRSVDDLYEQVFPEAYREQWSLSNTPPEEPVAKRTRAPVQASTSDATPQLDTQIPETSQASQSADQNSPENQEPLDSQASSPPPELELMEFEDDEPPVLEVQSPKDSGDTPRMTCQLGAFKGRLDFLPKGANGFQAMLLTSLKPAQEVGGSVPSVEGPLEPPAKKARGKAGPKPVSNGTVVTKRVTRQNPQPEEEKTQPAKVPIVLPIRNVQAPIGIKHKPFVFPQKQKRNVLDIDMRAPGAPSPEPAEPSPAQAPEGGKRKAMSDRKSAVQYSTVTSEFQAELTDCMEYDATREHEEPDRDHCVWTPVPSGIECNYKDMEIKYWKAIWRQFEGHIPYETALEHLMKNRYIFSESLNTIDQTLKELPQTFKPICRYQAEKFATELAKRVWDNPKTSAFRRYQVNALRNYHLGEIREYYYKWKKLYQQPQNFGDNCNCWSANCDNIAYEPRWACYNCTKHIRPRNRPAADSEYCLICQAYKGFTGRHREPRQVVLRDFELAKLEEWMMFERQSNRRISRPDFEKMSAEAKNAKWLRGIYTEEEKIMLFWKADKPVEYKENCRRLQPFVLPHFIKCNCSLYKNERAAKRTYGLKTQYTEQETRVWMEALKWCGNDCHKVAVLLKREPYEVKQFCNVNRIHCPSYGVLLSNKPPPINQWFKERTDEQKRKKAVKEGAIPNDD